MGLSRPAGEAHRAAPRGMGVRATPRAEGAFEGGGSAAGSSAPFGAIIPLAQAEENGQRPGPWVRMKKILIAGYYGFGNLGDEAIQAALAQALPQRIPGCRITVVSGDPERAQAQHPSVSAVGWRDLSSVGSGR